MFESPQKTDSSKESLLCYFLDSNSDIHFQYNGFLFGLMLLSVARLCQVNLSGALLLSPCVFLGALITFNMSSPMTWVRVAGSRGLLSWMSNYLSSLGGEEEYWKLTITACRCCSIAVSCEKAKFCVIPEQHGMVSCHLLFFQVTNP